MKVIDIINEEPLTRVNRGGRDDSGTAGVAGAAAAGAVAADRVKGKSGQTVSKEIGKDITTAKRFVRKYRGDQEALRVLSKIAPTALRRGALRSIPLAGIVIGGYFAGQQLAKGSVAGAAQEFLAGLGSVWTAVPLTVNLIVRDMYDQVYMDPDSPDSFVSYEQDLIQDPSGTADRLANLARVVTSAMGRAFDDLYSWGTEQGLVDSDEKKRYLATRKAAIGH